MSSNIQGFVKAATVTSDSPLNCELDTNTFIEITAKVPAGTDYALRYDTTTLPPTNIPLTVKKDPQIAPFYFANELLIMGSYAQQNYVGYGDSNYLPLKTFTNSLVDDADKWTLTGTVGGYSQITRKNQSNQCIGYPAGSTEINTVATLQNCINTDGTTNETTLWNVSPTTTTNLYTGHTYDPVTQKVTCNYDISNFTATNLDSLDSLLGITNGNSAQITNQLRTSGSYLTTVKTFCASTINSSNIHCVALNNLTQCEINPFDPTVTCTDAQKTAFCLLPSGTLPNQTNAITNGDCQAYASTLYDSAGNLNSQFEAAYSSFCTTYNTANPTNNSEKLWYQCTSYPTLEQLRMACNNTSLNLSTAPADFCQWYVPFNTNKDAAFPPSTSTQNCAFSTTNQCTNFVVPETPTPGWLIAVIVIGSLLVLGLLIYVIVLATRRYRKPVPVKRRGLSPAVLAAIAVILNKRKNRLINGGPV